MWKCFLSTCRSAPAGAVEEAVIKHVRRKHPLFSSSARMIWMCWSLWSFLWIFWIITNKIYAESTFPHYVQGGWKVYCFYLVVSGFFLTRSRSFCFSLNHHRSSFVCKCVLICSSLMPTARKQHPSLFLFNKCVVKAEWFYAGAFLLLRFCSVPRRALVNGKIKQRAHAAVDVRVWVSLDWFFRSALNNLVYSGMKGHRGSFVDAEVHDWFLIYCPPSILFSLSHSFSMLFSSSKYSLHLLNTLHLFPRLSSITLTCCTCYITDDR